MKATVTVRSYIDRVDLVENFSDELIDEIRDRIQKRARQLVPVRTGKLKRSIRIIKRYSVGSTVKYAGYVEDGTRYMLAQPYMKPATDDVIRTLPSIQREAFRDAARRSKG